MARNTRTFSDIDLNFIPSPIATEKVSGIGTITTATNTTTVTGTNTIFDNSYLYKNLYVGSTFIGKIKSVTSATQVTLYNNATVAVSNSAFMFNSPGDVSRKYDDEAIKASIRNIVLTVNYERPFNSALGSQLRNMLFELITPFTTRRIEQTIAQAITNFEPRVRLIEVKAKPSPDNNSYYVKVEFTIVNTETPLSVTILLERTR